MFEASENKHGDAPIRALIAERMNMEPTYAWDASAYRQFGPVHLLAMRPFLKLDRDTPRASRWLSLIAGVLSFFPLVILARRLYGDRAAALSALAMAVSSLHLQASVTAASEALYIFLMLMALERFCAGLEHPEGGGWLFALSGLFAGIAGPVGIRTALLLGKQRRGVIAFTIVAAALPAAWFAFMALKTGDPLGAFRYISSVHAGLGADTLQRLGPVWARARQLGIWGL